MNKDHDPPAISRRSPPAKISIKGIQGNVVSFASPGPAEHIWRKQLKATLVTVSDAFVDMALHHLERAARMPGDGASNAALALQAACTHMIAMVMMARIGGGHGGDRRLPGMASASAKLLRAYCTQIEMYRRLRGGGEQKIIVKHVPVNEGGQAIVGAVNSPASEVGQ